eukprot:15330255-Ditylum_brightwellii.AAC.1
MEEGNSEQNAISIDEVEDTPQPTNNVVTHTNQESPTENIARGSTRNEECKKFNTCLKICKEKQISKLIMLLQL